MISVSQRGDTLVEVLVSIAVMSTIIVGALGIMNRGIGQAQNAVERTQVRTQIDSQIDLLTYARDQYAVAVSQGTDTNAYPSSLWRAVQQKASQMSSIATPAYDSCTAKSNSFYISYDNATTRYVVRDYTGGGTSTSGAAIAGRGLWIDTNASNLAANYAPYVDIFVKACWSPVAGTVDENMSTAMRLYDKQ